MTVTGFQEVHKIHINTEAARNREIGVTLKMR